MGKKNIGSRFDDFLQEEAILEDATAVALKRVIAWQIAEVGGSGDPSYVFLGAESAQQNHRLVRQQHPFAFGVAFNVLGAVVARPLNRSAAHMRHPQHRHGGRTVLPA